MNAGRTDAATNSLARTLKTQSFDRGWPAPNSAPAREDVAKLNETAGLPTRTTASTIEALLYELRSGLSCLEDDGAVSRLRRCDGDAIRTISAQLLSWEDKGKPWLPHWTEDDVAKLVAIWEALR
jgi:hypothetical protein